VSGGGARSGDARDVARLRAESVKDIQEDHLDAEVNRLLRRELATIGSRDVNLIKERLDVAKEALGDAVEGSIDLLFGGSVAKHTYVDGLSDVDALVVVDRDRLGGASPDEVLDSFTEALALTHEAVGVEVTRGRLAVTMKYPDGSEIQLLPAVQQGESLAISDPSGKEWSRVRPDRFAKKLTEVNASVGGQAVPTIKLAKRLISTLPVSRQITGYHAESLAIEAFENYGGRQTVKDMLTHFFEVAATRALAPIKDSSGQSVHVDGDLGVANSVERRLVSDGLARLGRRLRYATTAAQWEAILRE
jgi:hypothetical protein